MFPKGRAARGERMTHGFPCCLPAEMVSAKDAVYTGQGHASHMVNRPSWARGSVQLASETFVPSKPAVPSKNWICPLQELDLSPGSQLWSRFYLQVLAVTPAKAKGRVVHGLSAQGRRSKHS